MILLLVFLLLGLATGSSGVCTPQDRAIWTREGHTWSHVFRAFGGLWVSQSSYEERVRDATGLTSACASCYGDAYICGYSNCKWSCMREGMACDACLTEQKCIENCNKCTGF